MGERVVIHHTVDSQTSGGSSSDGPPDDGSRGKGPPPIPPSQPPRGLATRFGKPPFGPNLIRLLILLLLLCGVVYGSYFWLVRRVVVGPDEILVLIRKNGSRSLPKDQIIIPHPPDADKDEAGYAQWEKDYGDCNGILEQVLLPGTYFGYSPFDYERLSYPIGNADIPSDKVGVVVRKFGERLDNMGESFASAQVMADANRNQRGPLQKLLSPGKYYEYANPFAYEIKLVSPVQINPGNRGIVTLMTGKSPVHPDEFLVADGERGVLQSTEPEGMIFVNPFEKRITPVSIQSQRFEMSQAGEIHFPSSDSFDIKLDGFVEWSIQPDKLPLTYVEYSEGGGLIELLEQKVILPYARSFCRVVGSQYKARDFISGDTKLKFQQEFETRLRDACATQGIIVLQALVRDIVPPEDIKNLINEREIAKEQIKSIEQQIQVAKSSADLVTQTEQGNQNQAIGDANKQVVSIVKKAEQDRDVAVTQANQELAVAKLRLEASQKEADALIAHGTADAGVILLQRQAEAEPLKNQVSAYGDGFLFAQHYFYQQVAPSIKSILTNADGPFADVFKELSSQSGKSPATHPSQEVLP
jgi:regulator of protease activity HflC (stomatin/prohibitin superfamily)